MNVIQNFIELPIFNDEYIAETSKSLPYVIVREDGDWRNFIPKFEDQFRNGFESQACATYATINAGIEILMEEKFGIIDADYSDRYIATLAGTTTNGNNPHRIAETIRKYGMVTESDLPFDVSIDSWDEFYDKKDVEVLKQKGKEWLRDWDFKHEWVLTKNTSPLEKVRLLSKYLKCSPIAVSVCAWWMDDSSGMYYKPQAEKDNHLAVIVGEEIDCWIILDTYEPYLKRVMKKYDFTYAKRYALDRRMYDQNWIFDFFKRLVA